MDQLDDAVIQFGVRTLEGREMHSLMAGKARFSFTKAVDEDVGKVDKKTGKVTFVGQSPLEMVWNLPRAACSRWALTSLMLFQMVGFIEFCLSKRVTVVDEEGEPIGAKTKDRSHSQVLTIL